MTEHTPGPWTWEPEPNGMTFSIWHDNDVNVAETNTVEDACLIAAAPHLLEMVRLLKRSLIYEIKKNVAEGDEEGARLKTMTLNLVSAAIAKAKECQP